MSNFEEHRHYLADPIRTSAYRRALRAVVPPGGVVVDLGSGTGVMGLLACEAGAGRVFAIDAGPMAAVARQVFAANGVADRVTVIQANSEEAELPELADVVVADQIGHFGFEAGLLRFFADARRRFLKPEGRTVPSRLDLWVAAAGGDEFGAFIDGWPAPEPGLDFEPVRRAAADATYRVEASSGDLRSPPALLVSLAADADEPFAAAADLVVDAPGVLDGVVGWFNAWLTEEIAITNSPVAPERIDRRQRFLPLGERVEVEGGDELTVTVTVAPRDVVVSWHVVLRRAGQEPRTFSHSSLAVGALTRDALARTRPGFEPVLSQRGAAYAFVLAACDGQRRLDAIEAQTHDAFPELFPSLGDAQAFVAGVIGRHTSPPQ